MNAPPPLPPLTDIEVQRLRRLEQGREQRRRARPVWSFERGKEAAESRLEYRYSSESPQWEEVLDEWRRIFTQDFGRPDLLVSCDAREVRARWPHALAVRDWWGFWPRRDMKARLQELKTVGAPCTETWPWMSAGTKATAWRLGSADGFMPDLAAIWMGASWTVLHSMEPAWSQESHMILNDLERAAVVRAGGRWHRKVRDTLPPAAYGDPTRQLRGAPVWQDFVRTAAEVALQVMQHWLPVRIRVEPFGRPRPLVGLDGPWS